MKTELIKISKLKLLDRNPRRITKEQMDKLCRSIEADPNFLQCRPVLVNCLHVEVSKGDLVRYDEILHVYAGNQRVRAAKKLGMKEIPCIVEYDLDKETVKKRMVQDNKTYGEWDWDILANEFDIEMLLDSGFTADELVGSVQDIDTNEDKENRKDEEVLEPPKDPKTKPGDLYELGAHRLKCGDSTNASDVVDLLAGAIPVLMVTIDPAYCDIIVEQWCKITGKKAKRNGVEIDQL